MRFVVKIIGLMLVLIPSSGNASTQPSTIGDEESIFLVNTVDRAFDTIASASTPPYSFETLARLQGQGGDIAEFALKQFVIIAEDPLSPLRFLACAQLCGLHEKHEYREIAESFMRIWTHTYGDKDQYEAADYLLTYGSAEDQAEAKKSLFWIFNNNPLEKEAAVFSLWIHGDKGIHKTLRSYVRSRAQEEAETAYEFAELLNNHGNKKDNLIAAPILARWTVEEDNA